MPSENTKRIAKNTLMLYFRMLLSMLVSLFTVRVVLNTLGVIDYGIYNVVGGIVTMFSFLSGTMSTASQRFFAFELGRKNYKQLEKIFSLNLTIYMIIAIITFVLAETVGLWFLNTHMTIPVDRIESARWVYQFSILAFMMTMLTIPYNAAIIAHERMNVYAWVSIIEVLLKLLIVYLLLVFDVDKLKLFAVLTFLVTAFVTFIYRTYCKKKFSECNFSFYWDKSMFKEIVSYSGWNLFGALAAIFNKQGINIVLNLFFGPVINAAYGIANRVNSIVNSFVQNFITAARPQITKYYAANEKEDMLRLVFQSSKFSFLLLFILSMPVLLETNFIFSIWLGDIPEYVVLFTRLLIMAALIDSLSYPLMATAQATGKIKKYQSIIGGTMLLNLPVSWLCLKAGFSAQSVFYIIIISSVICLFLRLILLKNMVEFPVLKFITRVMLPLVLVSSIAYIAPFFIKQELDPGLIRFFITGLAGLISSGIASYSIALTKTERNFINHTFKQLKCRYYVKKGIATTFTTGN